jgi:ribonucleoside-triphosphate reductase (thioredoxin)
MDKQVTVNSDIDFMEEIANFTSISKYARYDNKKKRREVFEESISRVERMHLKRFDFLEEKYKKEIESAFEHAREKWWLPSGRSMQFGGKAIEAKHERGYNCCMRHIDSLRSFSEVFFLLLCGCGVGIGLNKRFLDRLPKLVNKHDKNGIVTTYKVADTIEGWADSIEVLMQHYCKNTPYTGRKIVFDYSAIRPAGSQLKTGGGKAPGHEGLCKAHIKIKELLDYIIEDLNQSTLKSINVYDIVMHSADAVLSGGVRRSATIAIFQPDDVDMMNAKTYFNIDKIKRNLILDEEKNVYCAQIRIAKKLYDIEIPNTKEYEYDLKLFKEEKKISWHFVEPQRGRSNNSVILVRRETTKEQFESIIEKTKQFGEPGFIFADDRYALPNPCTEVVTIPVTKEGLCGVQFCNLTVINGAKIDTKEKFKLAVKDATIVGTLQATYTDFPYLSKVSEDLTKEEALLGVSITGMMDNPDILMNKDYQEEMAQYAIKVNVEWAKILNIKPAARITLIKPEGTSSLVLGSSSGIHAHHAPKYFRRIQCNKLDNVYKYFRSINPHACEESVWSANKTDDVITFPIEVKTKAKFKNDLTAIDHLRAIKSTQQHWVVPGTTDENKKPITHSISCTVIVKDEEWGDVVEYIYDNKKYFAGISFLPSTGDKLFKQAPLEAVSTPEDEAKWAELISKWKHVDYKKMEEEDDETTLQQEASCVGGACELVKV